MAPTTAVGAAAPRQFTIIGPGFFHRHYEIESSAGQLLFYVERSIFTPGKPDLILNDGPDSRAPVVAVSHESTFFGNFTIGRGNPDLPNGMCWEPMDREGFMTTRYTWAMTLAATGARKTFVWKSTHSFAAGSRASLLSSSNYKLVGGTGQFVAVFSSSSSRGFK